jgi:transcriptional regulator with XRE-family HTH domain
MSTTTPRGIVPYAAIVGKLLQQKRDARGILQATVAEALGLSQSAYSRLEKGESAMSITQLRQIGQVIGVHPDAVLAQAEQHAAALKRKGVEVTEERSDNTAALLIGIGILLALLAAAR